MLVEQDRQTLLKLTNQDWRVEMLIFAHCSLQFMDNCCNQYELGFEGLSFSPHLIQVGVYSVQFLSSDVKDFTRFATPHLFLFYGIQQKIVFHLNTSFITEESSILEFVFQSRIVSFIFFEAKCEVFVLFYCSLKFVSCLQQKKQLA